MATRKGGRREDSVDGAGSMRSRRENGRRGVPSLGRGTDGQGFEHKPARFGQSWASPRASWPMEVSPPPSPFDAVPRRVVAQGGHRLGGHNLKGDNLGRPGAWAVGLVAPRRRRRTRLATGVPTHPSPGCRGTGPLPSHRRTEPGGNEPVAEGRGPSGFGKGAPEGISIYRTRERVGGRGEYRPTGDTEGVPRHL
jgi:hypothetical protein